jgi:serine/threonine protein kinase
VLGRQISHFHVIRSLGGGGMGDVYEAQDTRLPRSVAIKFLKPALTKDVEAVGRFKREARLAASLNHPNICTILEVDEGQGAAFIAMELLQGRSLKARLAGGPLPLDEILDIGSQVADALATAHDQGILHRDITPGNIFLTEGGVVKLLDFGLAKHFASIDGEAHTTEEVTGPERITGTIHYMAPEQLTRGGTVDYRCDLFSLGVVLYQMATGARPFEARSTHEVITLIQEQPHVPMRQLAPQHPEEVERIIDTLLAKRPEDRYQTAWALRAELELIKRRAAVAPKLRAGEESRRSSVAVLPFELVGVAGQRGESFRDGLAEDISSRLSGVRDLRVAPRTSTRPLAGEAAREIGRRLDVDMILEGSVQLADDRVLVIASLIHAATERSVVPALRFDRRFDDILTAQDEIARDIAEGLAPAFGRGIGSRHTKDPEAYHAFKRGQHYWKACFTGGWRQAIQQFQHAVERDPRFALAHVALADAYNFLAFYCLLKPALAFGVAREAAGRALEIDETLAAAHVELALTKFGGDWDWDGSEHEFRRALSLEPTNPLAHVYYSWLLSLLGREDAALSEAHAGHVLAPSSRLAAVGRAQTLYLALRYDEAIELCNASLRFDPDYVFATHLRGLCYLGKSMHPEAVADLEQTAALSRRAPFYLGLLGLCYGECGMRDQALSLVAELDRQALETYVPPQAYVFIYKGLGERDQALKHQERAYADGASPFNYLTPSIRDFYARDSQHKKRLEQMRLTL